MRFFGRSKGSLCECKEEFRSACYGAAIYEYEDKRYCVLHSPSENKENDFKKAVQSKLERKDFDFRGAVFQSGTSEFRDFKFKAVVHFTEATFCGTADFSGAHFSGEETIFSEAHFSGLTLFEGAQFSGRTIFSKAHFGGEETIFSEAHFSGEVTDFSRARFSGLTTFSKAHFLGKETTFTQAHFRGEETFFRQTTFRKTEATFIGTTFKEKVIFLGTEENRLFDAQSWVQFEHCRIDKPELLAFNTVLLRPSWFINMDVRKVDFTDVKWHGVLDEPEGNLKEEIEALKNHGVGRPYALLSQACRRLSANAEENREYPLANEFHYWSMDARRLGSWSVLYDTLLNKEVRQGIKEEKRQDITRFRDLGFGDLNVKALWNQKTWQYIGNRERFGFINSLYWVLSGYGVRPLRAFVVLIIMSLVFALLYSWPAVGAAYSLGAFDTSSDLGLLDYIGYFLRAEVYSLGALARLNPEPKPTPGFFQTLVIIAGILGPLQVALLALALRRKVMR